MFDFSLVPIIRQTICHITRTGVISNALTVNYTVGGTATNGTDYGTISTSVTFAANSSIATVTVDPTADTTVESDETVSLTLASGTGYTIGTTSAVTGTIANDDTQVTLAVSPSSVTEDGSSNLVYTFTRTGVISNALTVNYTVGGTATNSTDYGTIGTSVTFAANSSTATVTVDPTADTTVESDETVSLTLPSGTSYTISTTSAVTGTIANDDKTNTPPVLQNLTFTSVEDKTLNFAITDFTIVNNDPAYRDDDNNDLAAFRVISLPTLGTLTFANGQPISVNQRVSQSDLPNVRYNPNPNINGTDTFNITAIDNGTPEAESAPAKVTINITPVNDAPQFNLIGNIQAQTGTTDKTEPGFAQNISPGPNESSQKLGFTTTVTTGNTIFTKTPSIDAATGNLTYSLSKTPGIATVKVILKDDGGVTNNGQDTTEKEFTIRSAIPLNPNVFTPKFNISAGLTLKPETNVKVSLDTNRESATPDEVTNVQNGTKSNFNNIIGLYKIENAQGEILDDKGNVLRPGDANYALHALTTARVQNFALQAGGNDSTATQLLASGVLVSGNHFYAPFAIANGATYFPGSQGVENFVAAENGNINVFSSAPQYVRDLVATEGKDGDVFNNLPRFVQEPVAYFTFGAANPDKLAHFRSYGNGVYGFEDLSGNFPQYSNNDFNDAVFALTSLFN